MPTYIHVTTSATLAFLPHTNFKLCSLNELLYKHGLAPLSGEIGCGGFEGLNYEGSTRFALANCTYWEPEKLYKRYGTAEYKPHFNTPEKLFTELDTKCRGVFPAIQETIVYAMRDYQMGQLAHLNKDQIAHLQTQINLTVSKIKKVFMINYLTARFFVQASREADFEKNAKFIFSLQNTIPENFMELSDEQQHAFVNQLILPDTLDRRDVIQLTQESPNIPKSYCNIGMVTNFPVNYGFNEPRNQYDLIGTVLGSNNPSFMFFPNMEKIKKNITAAILHLEKIKTLLEKIIRHDLGNFQCHNNSFVMSPFPIAFILEDDNVLLEPIKNEFGSTQNLKLGEHIKTIVTDDKNISLVESFIEKHHLLYLKVESFTKYLPQPTPANALAPVLTTQKINTALAGATSFSTHSFSAQATSTTAYSSPSNSLTPTSTSSSKAAATPSYASSTAYSSYALPPKITSATGHASSAALSNTALSNNNTKLKKPPFAEWLSLYHSLPEQFDLQDLRRLLDYQNTTNRPRLETPIKRFG